jgi:hypothetical protein
MPRRLIWRIGNRTEEPDKNVNSWPRRRRNLGVGELLSSYSSSTIPMLQFSSKSVVISQRYDQYSTSKSSVVARRLDMYFSSSRTHQFVCTYDTFSSSLAEASLALGS